MKKILAIAIVLVMALGASFVFAKDVEGAITDNNYVIDLGLKNYVNSLYAGNIRLEVDLPVAEKFKLDFIIGINDNGTSATTASLVKTDTYTAINNYLQLWLGLPLTENIGLSIILGGGSAVKNYIVTTNGNSGAAAKIETKDGMGQINVGLGVKVGGLPIDAIVIRQYLTLNIAGEGDWSKPAPATEGGFAGAVGPASVPNIQSTVLTTTPASGGPTADKSMQYFGWNYNGRIMTGIPFQVGLPKLNLGLELGYDLRGASYSAANTTVGTQVTEYFTTKPAFFQGGFDVKFNIGIDYSNINYNFYVNPGYTGSTTSWKILNATDGVVLNSNTFNLVVGSNWKVTFAKIVYLKLDAEWKISITGSNTALASSGAVTTAFNQISPGINLGFKFEGWTLDMKWEPNFTTSTTSYTGANGDGTGSVKITTAADTNVWNLSNWAFSASCSFPPPVKE